MQPDAHVGAASAVSASELSCDPIQTAHAKRDALHKPKEPAETDGASDVTCMVTVDATAAGQVPTRRGENSGGKARRSHAPSTYDKPCESDGHNRGCTRLAVGGEGASTVQLGKKAAKRAARKAEKKAKRTHLRSKAALSVSLCVFVSLSVLVDSIRCIVCLLCPC